MEPKIESLRTLWKKRLTQNTGKALQEMTGALKSICEASDDLVQITSQYKRLERQNRNGAIDINAYNTEHNKIVQRLIGLINEIEENDLLPDVHLRDEFQEKILVVCHNEDRRIYLEKFFPQEYFPQLKYQVGNQKAEGTDVDIIIFDALMKKNEIPSEWNEVLRYYLENESPYLLYLGMFNPILEEFPEKAYATNSVFSIYARLREMTAFIKYYRPV